MIESISIPLSNGPRATIVHHTVWLAANRPSSKNIGVVRKMCKAHDIVGSWSTIATRAKDRISECRTAALVTTSDFATV